MRTATSSRGLVTIPVSLRRNPSRSSMRRRPKNCASSFCFTRKRRVALVRAGCFPTGRGLLPASFASRPFPRRKRKVLRTDTDGVLYLPTFLWAGVGRRGAVFDHQSLRLPRLHHH